MQSVAPKIPRHRLRGGRRGVGGPRPDDCAMQRSGRPAGSLPLRQRPDADLFEIDHVTGDVLATGALGPGLPQSAPAGHAGDPRPAPVTHRAPAAVLGTFWERRLPAATTGSS